MDPETVVNNFNECITKHDIVCLAQWMSDDHSFIDTLNKKLSGKESCIAAWNKFFRAFPDYENHFEFITVKDNVVTISGFSTCSVKMLDGPALWTARIKEDKIYEWRVLDDTPENRADIGIKSKI